MLVLGVVTCNRTEPNSTSEARTLIALTAPKVASSYIHSIINNQKNQNKCIFYIIKIKDRRKGKDIRSTVLSAEGN